MEEIMEPVSSKQHQEFPSNTESISLVEKMIDGVCDELNLDEDYYGNILIAITEAVNNAIHHGNKLDPSKRISVSFESKVNELAFTIEDQGEGFDFDNLPDPTDPANIEKPNGRGVFLMRHLADSVEFSDNGRKVELQFNMNISAN